MNDSLDVEQINGMRNNKRKIVSHETRKTRSEEIFGVICHFGDDEEKKQETKIPSPSRVDGPLTQFISLPSQA